jgi:hypothetical protein
VAVALAFSAVFIYFSATAFWKARRLASIAEKSDNA